MSAAHSSLDPGLRAGLPQPDIMGAVDALDATARLEAAGHNDRSAQRKGFESVFAQALAEYSRPAGASVSRQSRLELAPAVRRAVVLLAGVGLCIAAVPLNTPAAHVFIAGSMGWGCAQVTSTVVWWGRERQAGGNALRRALVSALVFAIVAAVVSIAVGSSEVLTWTLWAWAATVVLTSGATTRLTVACVGLSAGGWAGVLLPGRAHDQLIAELLIVVAALWAAAHVATRARGGRPADGLLPKVGWAGLCVLAQLATVAVAWQLLGPTFGLVAFAAIIAAACSEVVFDGTGMWARRAAARSVDWQSARMRTATIGAVGVSLVALVSLVAVRLVGAQWGVTTTSLTLAVAVMIATLNGAVSFCLRLGSSAGAARAAVAGLGLMLVVEASSVLVDSGGVLSVGLAVGCALAATAFASSHLATPKAW